MGELGHQVLGVRSPGGGSEVNKWGSEVTRSGVS